MSTSTAPTLQQIHDLRGENVHFLVSFRNKTWLEEAGIPTSQVVELDWWDEVVLRTQPGSDQNLKFVCTPALHYLPLCDWDSGSFFHSRTRLYGCLDNTLARWVVEQAHRTSIYFAG